MTWPFPSDPIDPHRKRRQYLHTFETRRVPPSRKLRLLFICISMLWQIRVAAAQTVTVSGGMLDRAQAADRIISYKGIPFARPPVGSLRWRPPQPVVGWDGVRRADAFGPACPQHLPADFGPDPQQNEDCLYLNIWIPAGAAPGAHLPVMVWIFGGGFNMGDAAAPGNDPANLTRQGVIVVTFNYRLGRLGWFTTTSLSREAHGEQMANFGLMDQIAALQWVHRNIAAFDGDPSNVTIFGTSSGGISVELLMLSPAARGLFAKAISQSGFGRLPLKSLADAEAEGDAFAKSEGANDPESLRKLPIDRVIARVPVEVEDNTESTFPILDGRLVPEQIMPAFESGKQARVPWMVGSNSYEASLISRMLTDPDHKIFTHIPALLRPLILRLFDFRGNHNRREIAANLATDSLMTEPARELAAAQRKQLQPVVRYYFAYVPEQKRQSSPGAMHGEEVPFIFQSSRPMRGSYLPTNHDMQVAGRLAAYWANFAKYGNPNGSNLEHWPMDSLDDLLVIDDAGEHAAHRFHRSQLDLLALIAWLQQAPPIPWVEVVIGFGSFVIAAAVIIKFRKPKRSTRTLPCSRESGSA